MPKPTKSNVNAHGGPVGASAIRAAATAISARGWNGDLVFDLRNGRNWRVGTVRISLGRYRLTLAVDERTSAVIDRELFRLWLADPRAPFPVGGVTWSVRNDRTWLTVNGAQAHAVPDRIVQHLNAVV
jgi:hypothetical protein